MTKDENSAEKLAKGVIRKLKKVAQMAQNKREKVQIF